MKLIHPEFLAAIVPVALFLYFISRRNDTSRGRLSRRLSLGLRGLIVLGLLAALSGPTVSVSEVPTRRVVFVLDDSGSMPEAERRRLLDRIKDILAEPSDVSVGVVRFAHTAEVVRPLGQTGPIESAAWEKDLGGIHTNIAAGLRLARGMLPPDGDNRILLMTDGNGTSGAVAAELAAAARQGIRVATVPVERSQEPDVRIERLVAPAQVRRDEPFDLEVHLRANLAARVRLVLSIEGFDWTDFIKALQSDYTLRRGVPRVIRIPGLVLREPREASKVVVRAEVIDGIVDRRPENNQAKAIVRIRRRAQVLLAEGDIAEASALRDALRTEGIDVTVIPPEGIPQTREDLLGSDALLLSNVAASQMSEDQMRSIRDAVVEDGYGLMMLGGDASFGPGGYADTPLEAILPVRLAVRRPVTRPTLAIVFVIDRSGSMQGRKIALAKRAALESVSVLQPGDAVGVLAFDVRPSWLVNLTSATDVARIRSEIGALRPGGGTEFLPALREAAAQLGAHSDAKRKHVVLLTDGQSKTTTGILSLVQRMAADGITVSTIGVGDDVVRSLLQGMAARGGGKDYYTADPLSIPKILVQETIRATKAMIVDEPVRSLLEEADRSVTGIDFSTAPPLRGYVATEPRREAGAHLVLRTAGGDPILAVWQQGLGRVAAFTSDAKRGRWGDAWIGWDPFPKFWAQQVRALMRRQTDAALEAHNTITVRSGVLEVTTQVQTREGLYAPGVQTTVLVRTVDGEAVASQLAEMIAPGLYTAQFPLEQFDTTYDVRVRQVAENQILGEQRQTIATGTAPEYSRLVANADFFQQAARQTGGAIDPPEKEWFAFPDRFQRADRGVGIWFILAAACLIPLDILLRRL